MKAHRMRSIIPPDSPDRRRHFVGGAPPAAPSARDELAAGDLRGRGQPGAGCRLSRRPDRGAEKPAARNAPRRRARPGPARAPGVRSGHRLPPRRSRRGREGGSGRRARPKPARRQNSPARLHRPRPRLDLYFNGQESALSPARRANVTPP